METRLRSGFEGRERRFDVFAARSGKRGDSRGANFRRNGADGFEFARRRDRETRLDDVNAEGFQFPRQPELFLPVHRKARRLLPVAKRGVEKVDCFHEFPLVVHAPVDRFEGNAVQFIILVFPIIIRYTGSSEASVDLSSLQVFLTVARERSFSRAAEKLYRTQPAVSISVRKLEDWVGQPLFVRGTGAGKLTEAGALLVAYAERMLNLREEAKRSLEDLAGLRRGRLALGVNESSIHALLPALERFRKRYPKIEIAIHRVFSRDIPREILNYRLDIGIASYRPPDEALAAIEFLRDDLTFVVPTRHKLARRRKVSIRDLGEEVFIAHIVASPYRERVIQLFARHRVPLRMEVEMPTIEGIKRFVERGMGVAIVPRMCVQREVERGQLAEVRILEMKLRRDLFLIFRRDRPLSHAAKAFIGVLLPRQELSRELVPASADGAA